MDGRRAYSFLMDIDGFIKAQTLDCAGDADATANALRIADGRIIEIWCDGQLVVRLNDQKPPEISN
jgi:hypothetical protein